MEYVIRKTEGTYALTSSHDRTPLSLDNPPRILEKLTIDQLADALVHIYEDTGIPKSIYDAPLIIRTDCRDKTVLALIGLCDYVQKTQRDLQLARYVGEQYQSRMRQAKDILDA